MSCLVVSSESEQTGVTSISQAHTLDEISEFWDTHSPEDYGDQIREVSIDVRVPLRRRVILEPDVYDQVAAYATIQGMGPDRLVSQWLRDRLRELQETP